MVEESQAPTDGQASEPEQAPSEKVPVHGRLIRELALVFLAFIAVGVALNCLLSYVNTRSTYLSTQTDRLNQIGDYAVDTILSSVNISDEYESWLEYRGTIKTYTDRMTAYWDSNRLTAQVDALTTRIAEEEEAGEDASADRALLAETQEKSDAAYAAYTYLSVEDMLSRLVNKFEAAHISLLKAYPQSKSVTYIAQSEDADEDGAGHKLLEEEARPEGYDSLWNMLQSGEELDEVAVSPDGGQYLMYVLLEADDTSWVLEVAMDSDEFDQYVWNQMASTLAVSFVVFSVCLAGMLFILRKTLVVPIETLASHVREYGRTKDAGVAGLIHGEKFPSDEVGDLADATESMIVQIQEHVEDVARLSAERERAASELAVAHRIQLSALPPVDAPYTGQNGFCIAASMHPAKAVGGDFYDFFMVDERRCAFLIADVSGKGVPAALFMMHAKTLLRQLLTLGVEAAESMTLANNGLAQNNDEEMFVTVWLGVLDTKTGKLDYSNGGHNPPLMRRADGSVEWLRERSGFFLGSFEDIEYRGKQLQMSPGDTLLLYTDGVTEAIDLDERCYGDDRLYGLVAGLDPHQTPGELVEDVKKDVAAYAGEAEQADDITILALRYEG